MKEITDIISAYALAEERGISSALITVVHVDGSAYRRAGARMLVTETGELTGAVSGGCLEGDALKKARLAMVRQENLLVRYDTHEDEQELGAQLGCNGILHLLIEPISAQKEYNTIDLLRRASANRERAILITCFDLKDKQKNPLGTTTLICADGQTYGHLALPGAARIIRQALDLINEPDRHLKIYVEDECTCFLETIEPAIRLVVAGAGNDAMPLADMARIQGWEVTVVDGRPNYPTSGRFPNVDHRLVSKAEEILNVVTPDSSTVFLLMTHNYNYDKELLRQLLPYRIPYIGALGPKKRLLKMLEELETAGTIIPQANHIYGPAGLDIGSATPEQIALSIIAQIQAVLSGASGLPLRDKVVIHDRSGENVVLTMD